MCLHSGAVLLFLCIVCLDARFAAVYSQRCSAVVPVYRVCPTVDCTLHVSDTVHLCFQMT